MQTVTRGHGLPCFKETVRVQLGDVCCAITCNDADVFDYLSEICASFISDAPADLNINLEIVNGLSTAEIAAALPQTRNIQESTRLVSTHLTLEREVDIDRRLVNIVAEKNLFASDLDFKFLNRLLPPVYFTACRANHGDRPPAMIVHGCGIVRHGSALVFTGPPETGKTTVARLCGDEYGQVLNDEMILVSWPDNDRPVTVRGLPIIGGVTQRLNKVAPLLCVLMLKQSDRTSLRRLTRKEAYLRLIRQVISPAGIEREESKRELLSLVTWFSDDVVKNAVFYEMEFNLDRELFWQVISGLEADLKKESLTK